MAVADLSLRHLQALVAVHEQGSDRRAADHLGYSQAAITQQIAALEKALGLPVFQRHGGPRGVSLTAVGEDALEAARDLLARAGQFEARCAAMRDGTVGRLAIGTFQSVSTRLLPRILADVRSEEPGMRIDLVESDDNDDLIAHLVSGRLDVTFLIGPVVDRRVEMREVCRDPFVAMVSADHDIAGDVDLRDLEGQPLIGHQSCLCHEIVEDGLRAAGVEATFAFRSNDNGAVQAMARAGLGIAVMPLLAVDPADPGVRVLSLRPPLPERQILVALPRRDATPAAARFVGRVIAAAG
ncbi:MAG: LysR family transcriptional regulator [bacterium]